MTPDHIGLPSSDTLESYVLRFERAAYSQGVAIADFAPPKEHPQYQDVVVELCRVELELSRKRGVPTTIAAMMDAFPWLESSPRHLGMLAEEWSRLQYDHSEHKAAAWPKLQTELKQFRLEKELGRGTFARVYLASQQDLANRSVVVKVTQRRTKEPECLARLQHENIVPIYSLQQERGLYVICMPYLGEATLAECLRNLNTIPESSGTAKKPASFEGATPSQETLLQHASDTRPIAAPDAAPNRSKGAASQPSSPVARRGIGEAKALAWAIDLAKGLAHAHQQGIVHGDIKPANLLISNSGRMMLLDFNLSADLPNGAHVNGKPQGDVGGTVAYMAPEQMEYVTEGKAIASTASDVYSAGLVIYEMLTGHRPFTHNRLDAFALEERKKGGVRLSHRDCASRDLANLVAKCLAPRSEDRYSSATELLEDLTRHANHLPLKRAVSFNPLERANKWKRRHPRLFSMGAVSTIAAIALVAVSTWALRLREQRLNAEALNAWRQVEQQAPGWIVDLTGSGLEPSARQTAESQSQHAMDQLGWKMDASGVGVTPQGAFDRLPHDVKVGASRQMMELAFYQQTSRLHHKASASNPNDMADVRQQWLATFSPLLKQDYAGSHDSARLPQLLQNALMLQSGNVDGARRALAELVKATPGDFSAWTLYGAACYRLGRWEEAENAYTVAIALAPHAGSVRAARGACRMAGKKFPQALEDWEAITATGEERFFNLINSALCCIELEEFNRALQMLNTAAALPGAGSRVYSIRSTVYKRLGDNMAASKDHARLLQTTPRDQDDWIARGYAKMESDPASAADDFREALTLDPQSHVALRNLAYVLEQKQNRPDDALSVLNQLVLAAPWDPAAWGAQGVLYARKGEFEKALESAEKATALQQSPLEMLQAACIYSLSASQHSDCLAKAKSLAGKAIAAEPNLAGILRNDPDLQTLRDLPDFTSWLEAVLGSQANNATPTQ